MKRRGMVSCVEVDTWSRGILARLSASFGYSKSRANKLKLLDCGGGDHQCWEDTKKQSAAFALLGRRAKMEDRFTLEEDINNTGISFFAIFDGHGGEFAADFAKDILVKNLFNKITESCKLLQEQQTRLKADPETQHDYQNSPFMRRRSSFRKEDLFGENKENTSGGTQVKRKDSGRKSNTTDDCTPKTLSPTDAYTSKLNSLIRPKENFNINSNDNNNGNSKPAPQVFNAECYIENGKINFGKMISDEILAADHKLVETGRKTTNVAGTTALIAIIQGTKLIVANVGDSRGVMCDSRGNAIPLSFDHKPQQVRERKRIHDAGGFIAFRGVWRVAGILATSRAMGDYPLKDKNLVIADPDILAFELNDHKPSFIILASDGLWDTFSNEEAVAFVKDHLNEPNFGAKALSLQSYYRGSVDNITVLVIVFKDGVYQIGRSTGAGVPEESTNKKK
ncbi:protein phosphatase 1L isoform X2 [Condylostylus longicornis]|uniref:protein phosphatase 1L isoform X2 n=1 Tax=Condylostylus longicornis TaxID=2530218 RepID=UPI00244DD66D|nr:protein phosphatase 1L isoform X2 [Condylostylus longicornis]